MKTKRGLRSKTPIIEDYGDGYMAFCPGCGECLGWESDRVETCPACGAEMEYVDGEQI